MTDAIHRPLRDPAVNAVIGKLAAAQQYRLNDPHAGRERDPHDYSEYGYSIGQEQGDLIYLLCRGLRATRVVEFATSVGMSTLYFAAAVRDNGGGTVIGSEIVPAKVLAAKRNLTDAGLADYADIREGDARTTLRDLGGQVDFALIDGWLGAEPSLARQVIEIITPQLRIGGYVMNDNAEPDFLAYIRDPANGFLSVTLPLHGGTELCIKVADRQ
ncbi:O-methyltransferase [Nocardia terpenica]|uniref:Methyltransferase n=1 Tax=Nocardia terpenica TaxID=455432 RepID=A0A6G9Z4G4_9NOCA|nr:class I SAM-dependent methyltransferase [Nocardia terpenica]QIS20428.1 methyltransferase [Nocardia terpenica]